MEETVKQHIPNYKDHNFKFIVRKGRASRAILMWSEIEHIDLIIMGNKSEFRGKGVNPRKIANVSHCSVLFVPEKVNLSLNKLFIPIDYSLRSKTAIDQALAIKEHNDAEIILQHVFFLPQGYHYTGKSAEEFAIIMRENSEKDYAMFMKRNGYDSSQFQDVYTFDDDDAPADKIYLEAMNFDADLIIISSRGRTKAASLLLGSSALELLKFRQKIPYMIIKDKHENMSFFQALMKI